MEAPAKIRSSRCKKLFLKYLYKNIHKIWEKVKNGFLETRHSQPGRQLAASKPAGTSSGPAGWPMADPSDSPRPLEGGKRKLVRNPTPHAGKLDQLGKNPARNTSNSAAVVKTSRCGMGFYPQRVRIIGVLALGPNFAIFIFQTPGDHQNGHCCSP